MYGEKWEKIYFDVLRSFLAHSWPLKRTCRWPSFRPMRRLFLELWGIEIFCHKKTPLFPNFFEGHLVDLWPDGLEPLATWRTKKSRSDDYSWSMWNWKFRAQKDSPLSKFLRRISRRAFTGWTWSFGNVTYQSSANFAGSFKPIGEKKTFWSFSIHSL